MTRPAARHPAPARTALAGLAGAACALAGLVTIWASRLWLGRPVYVSELGAEGMPTARAFMVALLLVAAGGGAVAWGSRQVRSRAPLVGRWAPAATLWVASGAFALASQVPCTAGCPVPVGATFTWQDLAHVMVGTLGFAAACVAMLQISVADVGQRTARASLGCAVAVTLVAGTGGVLALLRVPGAAGGYLEHVATTIAVGWLAALGASLALERRPLATHGRGRATTSGRAPSR